MFSSYSQTFNNTTRIGDDTYDISERNRQNITAANYMLTNFRTECPMTKAVHLATSQPSINFNGSYQVGINGCNIKEDNDLRYSELTMPKAKISLNHRPFLTVPFLGRGPSNPVLESQIQQGELANNRKSISTTSEETTVDYNYTPLIPSLKSTVTNPSNLVEGSAADGWVRGGMPSRELTRDKEFMRQMQ